MPSTFLKPFISALRLCTTVGHLPQLPHPSWTAPHVLPAGSTCCLSPVHGPVQTCIKFTSCMLSTYTITTCTHSYCIHLHTRAHSLFSGEGHCLNRVQKPRGGPEACLLPPSTYIFPPCEPSRGRQRAELSSLPAPSVVLDLVWSSLLRLGAHHHRQLAASGVPPHAGRGKRSRVGFSSAHALCMPPVCGALSNWLISLAPLQNVGFFETETRSMHYQNMGQIQVCQTSHNLDLHEQIGSPGLANKNSERQGDVYKSQHLVSRAESGGLLRVQTCLGCRMRLCFKNSNARKAS